jgi:pyrroloquinoline-quinone synthase
LCDVEEVDEGRARGDQPVDRVDRLAEPIQTGWDRGNGDVGSRGTQTPEGMLRRSTREGEVSVSGSVWERIEESRARHNVLEHPFYVRWSAGELSSEELARYADQYRHATEALARLCRETTEAAPERRRAEIAAHADEEEAHIGLWDGFVEAAGGEIGAEPTPETAECVTEWTAPDGYLGRLARMYAIESGQPEISRVKREGLARFYGIDGGPGSEYFRVHEEADHAHAEEARRLIEEAMTPDDEDALVAAADSAFRANWRLLDGVG